MKNLILLSLVLLSGCAEAVLAPEADRKIEYIETTSVPKARAYNAALSYLSKHLGDSNAAIKVHDEGLGQIVSAGLVSCNIFRQSFDSNEYYVKFMIDFKAKDSKAKLSFEDVVMTDKLGRPLGYSYCQIVNKEQLVKAKAACIEPFKKSLFESIQSESKSADF